MIAFTNEARDGIKKEAQESIVTLSSLRPSDDGMTLEEITKAIECLKRLVSECDSEIRQANRKRH